MIKKSLKAVFFSSLIFLTHTTFVSEPHMRRHMGTGTVLIMACRQGHREMVKIFLKNPNPHEVAIFAKDAQGLTALDWAKANNLADCIPLLEAREKKDRALQAEKAAKKN